METFLYTFLASTAADIPYYVSSQIKEKCHQLGEDN